MDRITGVMMSLLTGQVCGGEPPLPALTADEAAHLYALSKPTIWPTSPAVPCCTAVCCRTVPCGPL